ncbi:MAG TPA: hypothetical protein VKE22_00105, partial [Haliangiales bacterium]|nr:hypothetical protein [Haliangiales bacterium]
MRMVVVAFAWATAAGAAGREDREREYDAKLRTELEAMAPAAVPLWDAASAARERKDLDAAVEAFRGVIAAAPKFDAAHRRLCRVENAQGHRADAVPECREAMRLADNAANGSALAFVLVDGSADEKDEARRLASSWAPRAAAEAELELICQVALQVDDGDTFDTCARRLLDADPGGVAANYFGFIDSFARERWGEARTRLDRARVAGLPPDLYAKMSGQLDEREPKLPRLLALLGWAVA